MNATAHVAGRHLLYLLGVPGSGKSTLAARLTDGLPHVENQQPFAHIVWGSTPLVVEFGRRRPGGFGGTDALSMSVQPRVVEWLRSAPYNRVLAEGDRLANGKFFQAVLDAGWSLTIAHLDASSAVADARRLARASELELPVQSSSWLKGRLSKVARLVEEWRWRECRVVRLDADRPVEAVLDALTDTGDPVAAVLRTGVVV